MVRDHRARGGHRGRSRLTGCMGRLLPARGQKFALELKQPPFRSRLHDEVATRGLPSMNELELDYGSRINSADEVALKRSVGPNVFEILNDGLVSEPITPTGAA
jgi:hypothetical protein